MAGLVTYLLADMQSIFMMLWPIGHGIVGPISLPIDPWWKGSTMGGQDPAESSRERGGNVHTLVPQNQGRLRSEWLQFCQPVRLHSLVVHQEASLLSYYH